MFGSSFMPHSTVTLTAVLPFCLVAAAAVTWRLRTSSTAVKMEQNSAAPSMYGTAPQSVSSLPSLLNTPEGQLTQVSPFHVDARAPHYARMPSGPYDDLLQIARPEPPTQESIFGPSSAYAATRGVLAVCLGNGRSVFRTLRVFVRPL